MNCQADYQTGFRVPLLVISAYTPKQYIDNDTYDFGSILRTIEGLYGIPERTMGVADARSSTDLVDFFQGAFRSYTPIVAVRSRRAISSERHRREKHRAPDYDGDED